MLNLKELETKLDLVLASETLESLTEWLMAKRVSELKTLLGEGEIEHLEINTVHKNYVSTIEFIRCEVAQGSNTTSNEAQKTYDTFSNAA